MARLTPVMPSQEGQSKAHRPHNTCQQCWLVIAARKLAHAQAGDCDTVSGFAVALLHYAKPSFQLLSSALKHSSAQHPGGYVTALSHVSMCSRSCQTA
jgi:hypothetical protein